MKDSDNNNNGGYGGDYFFDSWYVAVCHGEETHFLCNEADGSDRNDKIG